MSSLYKNVSTIHQYQGADYFNGAAPYPQQRLRLTPVRSLSSNFQGADNLDAARSKDGDNDCFLRAAAITTPPLVRSPSAQEDSPFNGYKNISTIHQYQGADYNKKTNSPPRRRSRAFMDEDDDDDFSSGCLVIKVNEVKQTPESENPFFKNFPKSVINF
jgi:hypothetical protein